MKQTRRGSTKRLGVTASLLLLAFACESSVPPTEPPSQPEPAATIEPVSISTQPALTFYQLDIAFDGDIHANSEWGAVDLEYSGTELEQYFNLAVGGVWRIQNVPVTLVNDLAAVQQMRFHFDLGVVSGTDVSSLSYDFAVTSTPLTDMPPGSATAGVSSKDYALSACIGGGPIAFTPPSPTLAGGPQQQGGKKIQRRNFPNQEAGKNECVPVAASNSLQWMKRRYRLNINDADISIDALKTATGWTAAGVTGEWWIRKQKYLDLKKIPITTTNVSHSIDAIVKSMMDGCDVELVIGKHAVAITGVTQLANGNYTLVVANDTEQGKTDGRVSEFLTFNTTTKTFEGAPWANGLPIKNVVVECKK